MIRKDRIYKNISDLKRNEDLILLFLQNSNIILCQALIDKINKDIKNIAKTKI